MVETETKIRGLTAERVNLVIAGCAILISAASFYATFLQANAAERQVKAMTMPLIQFEHSNHNSERDQIAVSFTLKNAGIGPAIIKSVELAHQDKIYNDLYVFLEGCCAVEYEAYQDYEAELKTREYNSSDGAIMSRPLTEIILPGQTDYKFFELFFHKSNGKFWEKLNEARFDLKLNVCYCSLLDDCFVTEDISVITEVDSCPAN